MNNKEFKKINDECLREYGFEKFKKKYYLNLPNITIRLQYYHSKYYDGIYIEYDFLIRDLYGAIPVDCESIENAFEDNPRGYQMDHMLRFGVKNDYIFSSGELDAERWKKEFKKAIRATFEPFVKDDLYALKCKILSNKPWETVHVNESVKDYLKIR